MSWVCALLLLWLSEAHAALIFRSLTINQSVELSFSLQQNLGSLRRLHLYHRDARSQTTLLSMAGDGEVSVAPEHGWRLRLSGGPRSPQVNVTLSHLQQRDTGLYLCELSYGEVSDLVLSETQVFVLVHREARPCQCSSTYLPLMLTIFAASGLLVAALLWLATDKCLKTKHRLRPRGLTHSIYEVMDRKQQQQQQQQQSAAAAASRNNLYTTSQQEKEEEVEGGEECPVYANPKILDQAQDSYYACPRKLHLRA